MEYITANAQPTPKTNPRKTPIKVGQRELMLVGVYSAWPLSGRDPCLPQLPYGRDDGWADAVASQAVASGVCDYRPYALSEGPVFRYSPIVASNSAQFVFLCSRTL